LRATIIRTPSTAMTAPAPLRRLPERPLRVGINGFGRIGRCIARQLAADPLLHLVAVNDLADSAENFVYLYNYDSTYGRAAVSAQPGPGRDRFRIGEREVRFSSHGRVAAVPWKDAGVDIVVDATGVYDNVVGVRELVDAGIIGKAIITHSPDSGVDRYVIMGVNDAQYRPDADHVVSTTICDANAVAQALHALHEQYGIERGFVTTLHPWLSYQNLVDGPVSWQAVPGAYWKDFSLGRASTNTLIPKNTTVISALRPVLPEIERRLAGFSFRTPTQIVCAADLTIELQRPTTAEQLLGYFEERFAGSPYVLLNRDARVGMDFTAETYSAAIDTRWIQVLDGRLVKLVLWYDNEWGYSARVIDLARLMARTMTAAADAHSSPTSRLRALSQSAM
jgi:glyceraldehyde 3-phosphate dehydrogenase